MTTAEPTISKTLDCELCIVGAGYAALNGLNAAAKYLKRGERVVVIDKNQTWGGQWLHQYDFVRLHQPYQMFTAGDQRWTLQREPAYLATRREVLDHLATVPSVSAGHLEIQPLFGHAYSGHRVRDARVEVDAVPSGAAPAIVRVRARRLLKATGVDIEPLPPFRLSSTRVRSVGVSDPILATREFLDSREPIYIIGSGKTAMDSARQFIGQRGTARRSVNIVVGSGMWFFVRDQLYPVGARRFVGGELTADVFLQLARAFDGQNEGDVMKRFERSRFVMNVFGQAGNCRYGLLSLAERAAVVAGLNEVYRGHLVDVDGLRMTVREGKQQRDVAIAEGAWFINCTTHLRHVPNEPAIQEAGLVCAPQHAVGFTGTSAYYLTHLWYRDELAALAPKLFRARIDIEPKLRFAPQMALMVAANMAQITPRLPFSIPSKFQGDFNKWYPMFRQLPTLARIMASQREMVRKAERHLPLRFSDPTDAT